MVECLFNMYKNPQLERHSALRMRRDVFIVVALVNA